MVLETVFNELTVEANRFLEHGHEYYKKRNAEDKAKAIEAMTEMRELAGTPSTPELAALMEIKETLHSMYVDRFLGGLCEEHAALKHYKKLLTTPNGVSIDDFMAKVEETSHIGTAMAYLRKLWIPQCGKGSQGEELSFNKALITAMQKHIEIRDAQDAENQREHEEWQKKYEAAKKESPYGYCPKCGAKGHERERRPNGDDICEKGCKYPSKDAEVFPPTKKKKAKA